MKIDEAKSKFIQIWGTVGIEWGINRTMAQVHGLLLTSDKALTTEQVMESLSISRGNANMNLRELISWGLVFREYRPGERKEYFYAEKNIWEVAQRIVAERKKRELDPMMKMIEQLQKETISSSSQTKEAQAFHKLLADIHTLGRKSSSLLELVLKLDQSTFFKPIMTFLKK
jgi:DNA-binding transcriptional regulator GbsR (MarR family)